MPTLPKTIATVACASLLATCPVLAGTASAHPSHPAKHVKTHSAKAHAHGKPVDHLAGLRRGAAHAVAAQLKAVRALITNTDALDLADESALLDALGADRAAVQADLDAVADASSRADLHALMTSANTSRQVARLQAEIVAAADAAGAEAATLGQQLEVFMGQLADMPDNPELAALLEDAMSLLTNVTTLQLPDVINGELGISPSASRAELHAAAVDANDALESIADTLAQVSADLAALQAG